MTQTLGEAESDGALCVGRMAGLFLEDIGACLWVLCGDQFLLGYCRDRHVNLGREDFGVKNLNIRV